MRALGVTHARELGAYAVVGVIGTALDFGFFWALIRLGTWTAVAVTLAFGGATAVQFFLNRHWTFRSFDRPALHQARTYLVVIVANWLVALVVVESGTRLLHLPPLVAKAISIPPSALMGYAGNRFLTFGGGIRSTYRRWRGHER
ncbi:MAG TPA: GtrA family protein [Candidatus Acidoferrales bacterium]|nr:GtrA family protein [Candidatus Acidoferrales bacterium]